MNTLTPGGVYRERMDRQFIESLCARVPVGRQARADELIRSIILLPSDASSGMAGANLVIGGGLTAW